MLADVIVDGLMLADVMAHGVMLTDVIAYVVMLMSRRSADVKPGLHRSQAAVRRAESERKRAESDRQNRAANKSVHVLEAESREEGLRSALPSDNRGFRMLQRMGYQPGTAIGKLGNWDCNVLQQGHFS